MPNRTLSEPTFFIRDIPIYGDKILSPMSNYSDMPFRAICRQFGSAMSYTEFVAVESILHGNPDAFRRLRYDPAERPVVFQIFGADVDLILRAAQQIEALQPDIIDINMGCSAKKVASRGAGAGLLKTPRKIARIFRTLTRALSVPVTGKIRLGWDENSLNYLEVAKILEDNGAAAIAVHGRTKTQAYRGKANWDAIAEIRQSVRIPVIGNGDVQTVEDVARMKAHTGCEAVMIGRAAIGNPWIFAGKNPQDVTLTDRIALIRRHLRAMVDFYGEERGLVLFRKHVVKYTRGLRGGARMRERLMHCTDAESFIALVEAYESGL
ncbi:MAG: tRNA dihydrouridine synthase DusB [Caldilineae bacterium]|nr:MAG: tRNA dihydrouridine synthase DusB [Caldilineae bacterium]